MTEEPITTAPEEPEAPQTEVPAPPEEGSADELRRELEALRSELAKSRQEHERLTREVGEFQALFPDRPLSALPKEVWEQVQSGVPLAAACALYEKKCEAETQRAEQINRRNAGMSSGMAGKDTPGEFFSPDEVRAMSPGEVRHNYERIRRSMKKWN